MVQKLTEHCHPEEGTRAWLWRDDSKRWVIVEVTRSIINWIGNPDLAYLYWAPLVPPPRPEEVSVVSRHDRGSEAR